jgi:hypothetical protein
VLLYHLVTGDYPVHAQTIDELREAHARREHRWLSELRPDLPVGFMQVVEKAIAIDVDERYANASELLAALSGLKIGPHPWLWRVAKPLLALAGALGGMFLLGVMTSIHLDITLQRAGFTSEGVWDWLVWGRRTSFPPFVILVMVAVPVSLLAVLRRVLLASSARLRTVDVRIRRGLVHRLRLDEAPVLSAYALLISAGALLLAFWYFTPLIVALLSFVATSPVEDLVLLSPAHVTYHNSYRGVFSGVVILSVALWYPVLKLIRKGQSVHWGLIAAGTVVVFAALVLLHFPYRLLYFNKTFEAVQWRDSRCYSIGERTDDLLLFCAELSPRNRIVKKTDQALVHLNVRESIFSQFGRKAE